MSKVDVLGTPIKEEKIHTKVKVRKEKKKHLKLNLWVLFSCIFVTGAGAGVGIAFSEGLNNETVFPNGFIKTDDYNNILGFDTNKKINGQNYKDYLVQHKKIDTINFHGYLSFADNCFRNDAGYDNPLPSSIKTINISSEEDLSIGNYSFYKNTNLKSINLSSITSIGISAFESCNRLDPDLILPNTLTTLGNSAFELCDSIETVDLSQIHYADIINGLGNNVFYGCLSLTTIYVASGEKATWEASPNIYTKLGIGQWVNFVEK